MKLIGKIIIIVFVINVSILGLDKFSKKVNNVEISEDTVNLDINNKYKFSEKVSETEILSESIHFNNIDKYIFNPINENGERVSIEEIMNAINFIIKDYLENIEKENNNIKIRQMCFPWESGFYTEKFTFYIYGSFYNFHINKALAAGIGGILGYITLTLLKIKGIAVIVVTAIAAIIFDQILSSVFSFKYFQPDLPVIIQQSFPAGYECHPKTRYSTHYLR